MTSREEIVLPLAGARGSKSKGYTQAALDAKIHGTVLLNIVVSVEGKATEIRIVRGLDKGLDQKAVECLKKWRFHPGLSLPQEPLRQV